MAKRKQRVPKREPSPEEEEKPTQPEAYDDDEEEDEVEEEEDEEEDEEEEDEEDESESEEEEEEEEEEEDEEEEDKIDPLNKESIRKLLEPFGKDQLIEFVKEAALKNPGLAARIASAAESDPVHRKIFVHGLGWDSTTETLAAAFSPFGDIEECRAVADRTTGRCKGYGFVLFRTRAAARRALTEPQKRIGGRIAHCQLASFGAPAGPVPEPTGRKIFVTNIAENVNPERLRAFFARFGEIEEGPLGYDKATGKLRGFAIFTYKTVEACKKALEEPKKIFEGCELNCMRALEGLKPKTALNPAAGGLGSAAALPPNDLALTYGYGSGAMMGVNPMGGLVGQGLNVGVGGVGLLNPAAGVAGLSPSVSRTGTTPPPQYGVGLGAAGGSGIGSINPSVMGSYGSVAALQGLGAYQGGQISSSAGMRSQLGIGSLGTGFPPYLGR